MIPDPVRGGTFLYCPHVEEFQAFTVRCRDQRRFRTDAKYRKHWLRVHGEHSSAPAGMGVSMEGVAIYDEIQRFTEFPGQADGIVMPLTERERRNEDYRERINKRMRRKGG